MALVALLQHNKHWNQIGLFFVPTQEISAAEHYSSSINIFLMTHITAKFEKFIVS